MQSMQNITTLSQLAADREARLRTVRTPDHPRRHVRRWFGFQLVRLGAWVASEPTMRAVSVR